MHNGNVGEAVQKGFANFAMTWVLGILSLGG